MISPYVYSNFSSRVTARSLDGVSVFKLLMSHLQKIFRSIVYVTYWNIFRNNLFKNNKNIVISYFDTRSFKGEILTDDYFRDCRVGIDSSIIYKLVKPKLLYPGISYLRKIKSLKKNYSVYEEHEFITYKDICVSLLDSLSIYLSLKKKSNNKKVHVREFIGGIFYENLLAEHFAIRACQELSPKSFTYPWENLVWERTLNIVSKNNQVNTIGFQHTGFSKNLAQHFVDSKSWPAFPNGFPEFLYCNGQINAQELGKTLIPSHLGIVRALRQNHLLDISIDVKPCKKIERILVTLSYNKSVYLKIIENFQTFGNSNNIEVVFKPHPIHKGVIPLKISRDILLWNVDMDASTFDCIVSHDNSWIFEALLLGVPSLVLLVNDDDVRDFDSPFLRVNLDNLNELRVIVEDCQILNNSIIEIDKSNYLRRYFSNIGMATTREKLHLV